MLDRKYVTFEEFAKQVKAVEGIDIAVQDFTNNDANERLFPPYHYTTKFDGELNKLMDTRIIPLMIFSIPAK